jgi:rod shape-determining protein MreD
MRRIILPLFLGIFFITLQTTLFTPFSIQRVRPDIVLILTLYLGFSYPMISGGILAFFLGYLMDLFSGNSFGLYTFSRVFIFCIIRFFKDRFYLEGFLSQFLFAFSFALVEGFFILILLNTLNPNPPGQLFPLLFTVLLPQSFFTGLITPALFSLFNRRLFPLFNRHGAR